MGDLKVLTFDTGTADGVREVTASIENGRALTGSTGIERALGWELKPEGLCKGDVCVPVRDDAGIGSGEQIDVGAVAGVLGMSTLLDEASAVLAVSAPAADRRSALRGRVAPDFTLPDLDGNLHSLEEFKDRKRLLIAFASW